jgi:Flp pilus assembly protein TadD
MGQSLTEEKQADNPTNVTKDVAKSAEEYNEEGIVHYLARRYEHAEECFRSAVESNPNDADYNNRLGAALKSLGRN